MTISDKLTTIAENEQKVYDTAYSNGRQDEYHDFWTSAFSNTYQSNKYQFAGRCWNDNTFNPPPKKLKVYNAQRMFCECAIKNLKEIFERNQFSLDTSGCFVFDSCFYFTSLTHIPAFDMHKASSADSMFAHSQQLHTIDELILPENGLKIASAIFDSCPALQNITISGKFKTNISFSACTKLTHKSLISILDSLFDLTSDGTAAKKLTLGNTNLQKLTESEQQIAIDKGWILS